MKKFGIYFLEECKRSKWFIIILFLELCLCMLLTNIAIHMVSSYSVINGYYNSGMADKYYVEFNGERTIGEIKGLADTSELATMGVIGNVDGQEVRVVTPTVVNKMPKNGLNFSKKLPKDYREIYVNETIKDELGFLKGKIYDMPIENNGEVTNVKVKVIGYIDNDFSYYVFYNQDQFMTNYNEIIMCDNLPDDAVVNSGIFYNDIDAVALKKAGFNTTLMYDIYNSSADDGIFISMAIIVVILTTACVLTNYLINVDKMRKRYAVQYVTGLTYDVMYAAEILKVATVFIASMIVNVVLTTFLKTEALYGMGIASYKAFGHSVWIIGLVYIITLGIGLFKLTRVEPLESVRL